MPLVTGASYCGPHTAQKRILTERHLEPLTRECAAVLGDFKAVTSASHTTAIRPNTWPWLIPKERSGAPVDLMISQFTEVPSTRVRRYHGTKSYIDGAYGSGTFASLFQSTAAAIPDFLRVAEIQDHNLILGHRVPWTTPHLPEARCALWNRGDVSRYQKKISELASHLPAPLTAEDMAHTHCLLKDHIKEGPYQDRPPLCPFRL